MNELARRFNTEVESEADIKARAAAMRIHASDKAQEIAIAIKDPNAIDVAVREKLEGQRDFYLAMKAKFPHGGDRKSVQVISTDNLKVQEWCRGFGFSYPTVSRWEVLTNGGSFEQKRQEIIKRCFKHIRLEQAASFSSDSVEWYTPAVYVDAARAVLGEIDLDPASCAEANKTVKAKEIFTKDDKACDKDWRGRVFLNPPYGVENKESLAGKFCEKAVAEYTLGNVDACIILVNSVHSQAWQGCLFDFPICFVDHRIKFVSGDGDENKNPTFQNIFIYLGKDEAKFAEVFSKFGYVMERIGR